MCNCVLCTHQTAQPADYMCTQTGCVWTAAPLYFLFPASLVLHQSTSRCSARVRANPPLLLGLILTSGGEALLSPSSFYILFN